MQFQRLSAPLTAMALALATVFSVPRPSLAEKQREFFCGTAYGFPATLVRTEFGNVELMYWVRAMGERSPERRCQEVSKRLERFDSIGLLKYLKAGKVNNSPVICVTQYRDQSCSTSNVLVTLMQEDNPNEILRELLNISVSSSGRTQSNIYLTILQNERIIEPLVGDDGFGSVDIQLVIDFFTGQETPVFRKE